MRRKIIGTILAVFALGVLTLVGLVGWAKWTLGKSYAGISQPAIVADTSPVAVQRGEMLFQSLCMECHGGADGRATGKRLDEIPAFLGTAWSANLAHPEYGVHRRSDGALARVLRTGVLPDGRFSVLMNGFSKMGDDDVAAVLGYMRSRPPVFEPAGQVQPRSKLSIVGELILTYVAKAKVHDPTTRIPVPPKAPSIEYGRYMAQVLDCAGCHTAGFGSEKLADPNAFAGGFEFADPTGVAIFSRNITFDVATGIGQWSVDDLQRAVTRGVRPEGTLVRKPMPLFARLDRVDVEAIYAFLQSMPRVHRKNRPGGHVLEHAQPGDSGEVLFAKVGCTACHGDAGPFRDKLLGAIDKPDAEVADWILDPQAKKPGSPMPSFSAAIDRDQAERLAQYVKVLARGRRN